MPMARKPRILLPLLFLSFHVSLPAGALADQCECSFGGGRGADRQAALKLKYAGIAAILLSAALGILIPVLGRRWPALQPERDAFFVIKAFAAGVILATGMIHILPDAFESLTSPCLPVTPWQNFPFAGFTAMMSALVTLMIDTCATGYYQRAHFSKARPVDNGESGDQEAAAAGGGHGGHVHLHTHATHGHAHGAAGPSPLHGERSLPEHIRHRILSQVLELGILVHSVVVGISVGASVHPSAIRPLVAALCFHQFFEGIGLGGCIVQAKYKARATFIMALFFSLTTPVGMAVGIAITSRYDENSVTALTVEGLLDSASAGILIYMALVDLLAADFMKPRMQTNGRLQRLAFVALLLGVGFMSIVAKWA